jgi:hypothetical protein
MNYQRIDNFLPQGLFEDMRSLLMNGDENQIMPWFYRAGMADYGDTEGFLFGNDIFKNEIIPDMELFQEIGVPIVSRLPMEHLLRIKINCHPRQTLRDAENYPASRFHRDRGLTEGYTVGIYSLNTCNGYTEFEDETKLESTENSMLIFNGNIKHRSMGQTDENIRVNININFIE